MFASGAGRTVPEVSAASSPAVASRPSELTRIGSPQEPRLATAAAGLWPLGRNLALTMLLTDMQITDLLAEQKPEVDPRTVLQIFTNQTPKDGHRRHAITVAGEAGNRFQLSLRQSVLDPYDFSVILTVIRPDGSLNLRRHNGTSHAHANPLEGDRFQGICHVHEATARYQQRGSDAEHFARPTADFSDLATAVNAMLRAGSFQAPSQLSLEGP
jgi:hypothetical protein